MEILPKLLCDKKTRIPFLAYADKILRAAAKRYNNADRHRAAEEQIIISCIDPTPSSRHIEPPTQVVTRQVASTDTQVLGQVASSVQTSKPSTNDPQGSAMEALTKTVAELSRMLEAMSV
ncbi:unnamed protein product [Danaus chrysippus]|uniref:(African queen) hypothetical protein n=1 Tax=Danaus chrysippus TaxID=151541 RepID=A0A8J2QBK4_9NEOP|nr:unnamed protein product [Danaus chrysippus]